jgi:protein ATS1
MRNLEDKSQQIYTFGTGEKGELGAGNLIFASFKALPLADFPPTGTAIVDLAASMGHVVAVLDNGDVYGWGNSRQGQLGEPHDIVYNPRKFQNVKFSATRAICGKDFSVLVGATPSDYAFFGRDKWNSEPVVKSQLTKCQSLSAGWGNLIALDDDGKLHASGRNDHGQLPGPDMPKLTQVAVGSEHTVALTESGDVLAWGWGEHGNCGPTTENGDVIGRWNTIASSKNLPPGAKFVAVGAGCATSFICIRTAA